MTILTLTFSLSLLSFKTQAEVQILFYNVENLFDVEHDLDKNDWEFLPKDYPGKEEFCKTLSLSRQKNCLEADWTQEKLNLKIQQIQKVFVSYQESISSQVDLLGLVEVENENVVVQLKNKLGFQYHAVTDSPDERGIDVALLYNTSENLRFIAATQHQLEGEEFKQNPTRNILEVTFEHIHRGVSSLIVVFVQHWPSQAAPSKVRVEVAKQFMALVNKTKENHPLAHIISMGDYNTIDKDQPHPFYRELFWGPHALWDIHGQFLRTNLVSRQEKNRMPLGTYFFAGDMQWNILDRFFVSRSLIDNMGLEVDLKSYKIFYKPFMVKATLFENPDSFSFGTIIKNTPWRYDHSQVSEELAGFSDHFPIGVKLMTQP